MTRHRGFPVALIAGATLALAAASATAAPAGWTTVRGQLPASSLDAAGDGPRTLVVGLAGRRLVVATLRGQRVVRTQTLGTGVRAGLLRGTRVISLTGGAALVVWSEGGRIASSYRSAAGARFGASRTVSFRPAGARDVTRAPTVAAGPDGRVIVAWWGGPEGGRLGIWAADLGSAGRWGAPHEISAGTYPVLNPPVPPVVALGAAASPDGGFAVAWRQPVSGASILSRKADVVGVTRLPGGDWSAPAVLGRGSLTSYDLPVVAPSAGTLAVTWADSRAERPDGVTSTTCLVASVLRPGSPPATADVTCRAQSSPGVARLVAAADGGVLAAWQVVPDWGVGVPLRAGIELFRLAPGASAWIKTDTAVANTLGYWDLDAFGPRPGGGALLLSDLSQTVRQTSGRQVRAVLVRDDGTVERRLPGPRTPRLRPSSKSLFALSGGQYRGLLSQGAVGSAYLLRRSAP
ncbi:MAG: hypothetical protein KDC36_11115 [Thermoleophilia bacterium]|nr:hypothetical protein [Thermoleophilia bacterium]